MATKNKVEIELDGKNQGAIKAINGVEQRFNKFDKDIDGFSSRFSQKFSSIANSVNKFAGVFGIATGGIITGLGYWIKTQVEAIDQLNKTSASLGLTTEQLSTYRYAADLSGASNEQLEVGLRQLNKNLVDLANGTGEAKIAFNSLGISAVDAQGNLKNVDDILPEIADKFSQMENGSEKTAAAMRIFGESGTKLIPMLNAGAEGMREMQQEARDLGLEIGTTTANNASFLVDQMTRLEGAVQGLALTQLPGLMTELIKLSFFVENFSWGRFWDFMTFNDDAAFEGFDEYLSKLDEIAAKQRDALQANFEQRKAQLDQQREIENLNNAWKQQSTILQNQIITAGLDPQSVKLFNLVQSAEQLRQKYAGIVGATELINRNLEAQIAAQFSLSDTQIKAAMQPETQTPGLLQPFDSTQIDAAYNYQMEKITTLTDYELSMLQLREAAHANLFGNMGDMMLAFANLSDKTNKEMFAAFKAFAIAQATINTYEGASKAIAQGGIFGPVLAAAVIAAGLAQVANIASAQPGSRGGGGSTGAAINNYERTLNNTTNNTTTNNNQPIFNITINSAYQDPDKLAREIAPYIQKAYADGVGNG